MPDLLARLAAGERVAEPVAVVVAHPDDETAGLGLCLARLDRLTLIHLTDGAYRPDAARLGLGVAEYAARRAGELVAALAELGARPWRRVAYGLPDGAAIEHLPGLVERLRADLAGQALVLTHAYEHGHPDHDTAALAVARAAGVEAVVGEFAGYDFQDFHTVFGRFLPGGTTPEWRVAGGPDALAAKRRALAAHASQARTLAQFDPEVERLRVAPRYDFTVAPAEAVYERWGLGDAAAWRAAAAR